MSRRSSRPELVVISWRDIPAQVTASAGRDRQKALLSDRFQHAIDRAAAVAGLTDTDSYVNEWRRSVQPVVGDDLLAAAEAAAAEIEARYDRDRVEALVRNGGLDPDAEPSTNAAPTTETESAPPTAPVAPTGPTSTGERQ